jgi:frataxin-like iron-binding protein CyaY
LKQILVRWGAATLGAVLLALLAWAVVRVLRTQETPSLAATRNIAHPVPVHIEVGTLPLFRTSSRPTRVGSTATNVGAVVSSRQAGTNAAVAVSPWITALATDLAGNLWVASEGGGVYRFAANAPVTQPGTKFTKADGLGDDYAYAITCDNVGRVFVGHLNHGVSIYNGQTWTNFDVMEIPVGERVFAIKANPIDGSVWIATNRGLTRYSVQEDAWTQYTRADGLPSSPIQSLAFDKEGNLYAGSQCDGIAIGTPQRSTSNSQLSTFNERTGRNDKRVENRNWRIVCGPDRMPMLPTGEGLPCNLINQVFVSHSGVIYVATTTGLAWSRDKGETFRFVRGQDWADKVRRRYDNLPNGWGETPGGVLAEDYVTCLAEDAASGKIYVGYRQQGCGLFDPTTGRHTMLLSGSYANSILPRLGKSAVLGTYADGLVDLSQGTQMKYAAEPSTKVTELEANSLVAFPSPAKPSTLADLNLMLKEVAAVPSIAETNQPAVVALDDDWRTQGDWLGRYGRYWACLSAECSPSNYLWGAGPEPVVCYPRIGPNRKEGDTMRAWMQWLKTDDPRCLEMPPVYLHSRVEKGYTTWAEPRREASWDDHGEAYPMTYDGPHLYCGLRVPSGQFFLSLYFVNANGNVSRNRFRDYQISVRSHDPQKLLWNLEDFQKQPQLAHARVRDFYGGVWKRFLVQGPAELTIEVNRNGSFNTNLQAVMLDLIDEDPPPYFPLVGQASSLSTSPAIAVVGGTPSPASTAADQIVSALRCAQQTNPEWWANNSSRICSLLAAGLDAPAVAEMGALTLLSGRRAQSSSPEASASPIGTMFYTLNLFPQWEAQQRARGLVPARDIEKALRWNGDPSCSGKGAEFVTAYLSSTNRNN